LDRGRDFPPVNPIGPPLLRIALDGTSPSPFVYIRAAVALLFRAGFSFFGRCAYFPLPFSPSSDDIIDFFCRSDSIVGPRILPDADFLFAARRDGVFLAESFFFQLERKTDWFLASFSPPLSGETLAYIASSMPLCIVDAEIIYFSLDVFFSIPSMELDKEAR